MRIDPIVNEPDFFIRFRAFLFAALREIRGVRSAVAVFSALREASLSLVASREPVRPGWMTRSVRENHQYVASIFSPQDLRSFGRAALYGSTQARWAKPRIPQAAQSVRRVQSGRSVGSDRSVPTSETDCECLPA